MRAPGEADGCFVPEESHAQTISGTAHLRPVDGRQGKSHIGAAVTPIPHRGRDATSRRRVRAAEWRPLAATLPYNAGARPLHAGARPPLPRRSDAAEQLEFQRPGGFSDLRPSGENRGPWAGEPDASDDHVIGAGGAGYTNTDSAGNTGWAGGGQPHFNIQPTTFINFMIKL